MATTLVNARIDVADKAVVDAVLASTGRTWSKAIQALASYVARTREFPRILDPSPVDLAAERDRKRRVWRGLCGVIDSPGSITDADDERLLLEEMTRRYG